MLVLDTDHLSELEVRSPAGMRLLIRLEQARDDAFITAVTCEEQLRGCWPKTAESLTQQFTRAKAADLQESLESLATLSRARKDGESFSV